MAGAQRVMLAVTSSSPYIPLPLVTMACGCFTVACWVGLSVAVISSSPYFPSLVATVARVHFTIAGWVQAKRGGGVMLAVNSSSPYFPLLLVP